MPANRADAVAAAERRAADAVALVASWDVGYALMTRNALEAFVKDLQAAYAAREDLQYARNA